MPEGAHSIAPVQTAEEASFPVAFCLSFCPAKEMLTRFNRGDDLFSRRPPERAAMCPGRGTASELAMEADGAPTVLSPMAGAAPDPQASLIFRGR